MAQFRFPCSHCGQDIECDEQWVGQEIQCPSCQNSLIVPSNEAAPAPPPPPSAPATPQSKSKLKVTAMPAPAAHTPPPPPPAASAPRPYSPPKKKKSGEGVMNVVKIAAWILVLTALGGGIYYMVGHAGSWQSKEDRDSGGGEVGHIATLNDVLDKTEPEHLGMSSREAALASKREARLKAKFENSEKYGGAANTNPAQPGTPAPPVSQLPVIPPVWTVDVETAAIPEGRVNGIITGTDFIADAASVIHVGGTQVLSLRQGTGAALQRAVLIYLTVKPGEDLAGHTWTISKEDKGKSKGVTQIVKRWKTDPKYTPQQKAYINGYALKLEFGQPNGNLLPGKIFLSLPDDEQSVAAGIFQAEITAP